MIRAVRIYWPLIALLVLPAQSNDACTDPLCLDDGYGSMGKQTVAFNLGGDNRDVANAVTRVSGEKAIFIVGQVAIAAGNTDFGVVRLNDAGMPDGSFSVDGLANYSFDIGADPDAVDSANDAAVLPWGPGSDWRLVVVGQVERAFGGDIDFGILLLRPNGDRETSANGGERIIAFDRGGDLADRATAVAVDSLGRIVVGGTVDVGTGDSDWGFVRFLPNLDLDPTFGINGGLVQGVTGAAELRDLAVQPDGKIVAVGKHDLGDDETLVVRLNVDGSLDTSFGTNGVTLLDFDFGSSRDDSAWGVAIGSQGRIVVTGDALEAGNVDASVCIASLLPTGQLDPEFQAPWGYTCIVGVSSYYPSYRGRSVALGPDGRSLIASESVSASGNLDFGIFTLDSSGSITGTGFFGFDLGGTMDDRPRDLLLRPDGKLVGVGRAVSSAGDLDFATLRVWTDIIFFDGFESGDTTAWSSEF